MNIYAYGGNDPIGMIDPTGLGPTMPVSCDPDAPQVTNVPVDCFAPVPVDPADDFNASAGVHAAPPVDGFNGSWVAWQPRIGASQTPQLCPRPNVDWLKFGSGAFSTGSGMVQMVGGMFMATIGLAALPVPGVDIASVPMIAGGIGLEGYGAMNAQDGLSLMRTAFDGRERLSVLGNIGFVMYGQRGAEIGEAASTFLSLASITHSAAKFATSKSVLDATDVVATTVGMKQTDQCALR